MTGSACRLPSWERSAGVSGIDRFADLSKKEYECRDRGGGLEGESGDGVDPAQSPGG